MYKEEDVEATSKYVLLTPCKVDEDGKPILSQDIIGKRSCNIQGVVGPHSLSLNPDVLGERAITCVEDVWPTNSSEFGIYYGAQGDEGISFNGVGWKRTLINFDAFLILQHLIPGLKAHKLHEFVVASGEDCCHPLPHVDYGPLQWTGIGIDWREIADFGSDSDADDDDAQLDDFKLEKQWLELLTQDGKSDEEILKDAWMGRGNMWVFKHPGIFPIAEAAKLAEIRPTRVQIATPGGNHTDSDVEALKSTPLLTLPPELIKNVLDYLSPESVVQFISATRTIYNHFYPHIDKLTYNWIRQERSWYLPVGPIQCKEGDIEVLRWRGAWQKETGLVLGGERPVQEEGIPWFAYHLACQRSPNMRSRERIWKIGLEIKKLLTPTYTSVFWTAD